MFSLKYKHRLKYSKFAENLDFKIISRLLDRLAIKVLFKRGFKTI